VSSKTALCKSELVRNIRDDAEPGQRLIEQLMPASAAMGAAMLDVERAFQVGVLTVVEPHCWEAMVTAYAEFDQLRVVVTEPPKMTSADDIERFYTAVAARADQVNRLVVAIVTAAYERVSPMDGVFNRVCRRRSRRRLTQAFQQRPALLATRRGRSPNYQVPPLSRRACPRRRSVR
jgi:hypothetical protein